MSAEAIDETLDAACPACGGGGLQGIYRLACVPSHSCLLMDSPAEAAAFPRGDLEIGVCPRCGFITNAAVDPGLQAYSARYEETQGFSPRFQRFAHQLAQRLVERHDLHGKRIVEIGCGKGEFLVDICEIGGNSGVGIDPAVAPERLDSEAAARIEWIADYWSDRYAHLTGNLVLCRHTLEHIPATGDFMRLLRRTLEGREDALVVFELPDAMRVLREAAFWDIYYEHCSYFTAGALARQFRATGFDVTNLWLEYDGQYLLIEARPGAGAGAPLPAEEDVESVLKAAAGFRAALAQTTERWRALVADVHAGGRKVVLWGSGSKGVSFLTTLGIEREVELVVDINPHKHGKHMAGTGQRIVAPEELLDYRPDVVIAMNAIYHEEIGAELARLGIAAELLAV